MQNFFPFQMIFSNPHSFLGLHDLDEKSRVIRLWRPGALDVYVEVDREIILATPTECQGVFEVIVPSFITSRDYRVYHKGDVLKPDPYSFLPTLGDLDAYFFSKGVHYKLYEVLGARVHESEGCYGVRFALWAPSAAYVFLVADFNGWDDLMTPMRSLGSSGIWEIFIPGIGPGEKYKFLVETKEGYRSLKIDPMAYSSELRPSNASIVFDVNAHSWQDKSWMEGRKHQSLDRPINIYEVHLGSWKRSNGFLNYRELANQLAIYVKEMGFTHIELLPIAEHPLDESWGYQVSGFYAVTSRYGTPADFQYFVDHMHQNGIGVILDWVAAHFPQDDFSLVKFDGTCLYEHEDDRRGYHPHWNTCIFNYGRFEVSNFLIANALFWLDVMHIDGLRADAVASMLYLDYGRKEGNWLANIYGGNQNLEAIEFLKHLNAVVHEKFPDILMMAEESSSFIGVTHPLSQGGLGFDLKWNMGWMNDTLKYFKIDPFFRSYDQKTLTFGIHYIYSEKFMSVFSHDEVVHGKAGLLSKMPGDIWQKFANLRLLYSYMICYVGKKLIFMGGEIGQWKEWDCKGGIEWELLAYPLHSGLQKCVKDLNHFYVSRPAFWRDDFSYEGFEWVDFSDERNSVISYLRKTRGEIFLCVHNFTPTYFARYHIPLKGFTEVKEVFSSDREEYGGSGKVNHEVSIEDGAIIQLAPLATMIFSVKSSVQ